MSCERMKAALYTMAKTLLVVARTVAVYTTPKAQTLSSLMVPTRTSVVDLITLNPELAASPVVPEGHGGPLLRRRVIPTSSQPESDAIVLQLRDDRGGVSQEVTNFVSYAFNSHFLTPTDGFHFTIGDEAVLRSLLGAVYVGQRVSLTINGLRQADGYVDRIHVRSSREGGTELTIEGRDRLSKVVDANADPQKYRFTANNTLEDVLVHTLNGFGWTEDHVLNDNAANANIITGQLQGQRTSKKGKLLKSFRSTSSSPTRKRVSSAFSRASRSASDFGSGSAPTART